MSSAFAKSSAWLRDVERRTAALPEADRRELLSGLAEHLTESLQSGVAERDALARLGSAAAVAEEAFSQYQERTGVSLRPAYFTVKRVAQYMAAAFAVAAVLAAALLPVYTSVASGSAGQVDASSANLVQVNGLSVLLVLAVPLAMVILPLPATGRAWQPLSIVSTILLTTFAAISAASIGLYFLPAVLAAIAAAVLPGRSRRLASRKGVTAPVLSVAPAMTDRRPAFTSWATSGKGIGGRSAGSTGTTGRKSAAIRAAVWPAVYIVHRGLRSLQWSTSGCGQ